MKSNFERMIALAEEVFDTRNDPDQLNVSEQTMEQLQRIHPATISEYDDGNGPVVWVLIIPTTEEVMNKFLRNEINEQGILDLTKPDVEYDSIYLCSALVLPEYRRKGIAEKLCIQAIDNIRISKAIKSLFVWSFSSEGESLAEKISKKTGLELFKKYISI